MVDRDDYGQQAQYDNLEGEGGIMNSNNQQQYEDEEEQFRQEQQKYQQINEEEGEEDMDQQQQQMVLEQEEQRLELVEIVNENLKGFVRKLFEAMNSLLLTSPNQFN